jgi:hypothetical protein
MKWPVLVAVALVAALAGFVVGRATTRREGAGDPTRASISERAPQAAPAEKEPVAPIASTPKIPVFQPPREPDVQAFDYSKADAIVRAQCAKEYPTDFSMRAYCQKEQTDAVLKLMLGRPSDIPESDFSTIRSKCAQDYPTDFNMRAYCEGQQIEGYRKVR